MHDHKNNLIQKYKKIVIILKSSDYFTYCLLLDIEIWFWPSNFKIKNF
jgi:hypothetical protein